MARLRFWEERSLREEGFRRGRWESIPVGDEENNDLEVCFKRGVIGMIGNYSAKMESKIWYEWAKGAKEMDVEETLEIEIPRDQIICCSSFSLTNQMFWYILR